jgi:hypothetical protein
MGLTLKLDKKYHFNRNIKVICYTFLGVLTLLLFFLTPTQAQILATTPTIAPTTTSTPQHLKLLAVVQNLLSPEVCKLPCILGVRPSDSLSEIQKRLQQNFGQDIVGDLHIDQPQTYYLSLSLIRADDPTIALEIQSNGTNVEFIAAKLSDVPSWLPPKTLQLANVLETLQDTPEIYIANNLAAQSFFVVLVYNKKGIMVEYAFKFQQEQLTQAQFDKYCLDEDQNTNINLWVQDPSSKSLVEDRIYPNAPAGTIRHDTFYQAVIDATGLDAERFVKQITANTQTTPQPCISIPLPTGTP